MRPPVLHVFSRARKIPPKLALDGRFSVDHVSEPERWPAHCDFYVSFTGLTAETWKASDRLGCSPPVVLPEAADWLHGKLMMALAERRDVWLFVAARNGDLPS